MSRTRVYTEDTIAIISRFFAAIDALIAMKKLKSMGTYCRLYGIDKSNFYAQKRDYNKGHFQVSWLVPLAKDFNVSSDWVLLGKGEMFKKS